VFGEVPSGAALLRSGAQVGDDIYVSGTVGDARLALEAFRGTLALPGHQFDAVRIAMEQPQPRITLGLALQGLASSAIDVSDGLLGDLAHILRRSDVGATVEVDAVPRSATLREQSLAVQRTCTLAGGDDYELVFTAAPQHAEQVAAAARIAGVAATRFGRIEAPAGLRLVDAAGRDVAHTFASFDHF
jgi:thiamine-monophosphate kinase